MTGKLLPSINTEGKTFRAEIFEFFSLFLPILFSFHSWNIFYSRFSSPIMVFTDYHFSPSPMCYLINLYQPYYLLVLNSGLNHSLNIYNDHGKHESSHEKNVLITFYYYFELCLQIFFSLLIFFRLKSFIFCFDEDDKDEASWWSSWCFWKYNLCSDCVQIMVQKSLQWMWRENVPLFYVPLLLFFIVFPDFTWESDSDDDDYFLMITINPVDTM